LSPFAPSALASGGHRQTLLGYHLRGRLRWTPPTEDAIVAAEEDVRLLLRVSWQPGPRRRRPALVLVHGLGGWDGAGYGIATGLLAWARGWHVVRMNMRGAGDGVAHCARLYNAGLHTDLVAVLGWVAGETPALATVGFSLGGNLVLLALARQPERLPPGMIAGAAVSPPLDLAACARSLERPTNWLYQHYFMRGLREGYRLRQALRPDLYAARLESGCRTVREFDDQITAPYGGHRDAAEYYARSSAGPLLSRIRHPALVLAAADDPMIPAEAVTRWPAGTVLREILPTGGHTGFVAPTAAPGRFWAGERALAFLESHLPTSAMLRS
jgi:predicted alpha/beta-fold hydrolase